MDNRTHDVCTPITEAMTVEAQSARMVTRIGFAERWLHRARTQCADGDVVGGLLTLALADAEVRYALEAAGIRRAAVTDAVPPARLRPAWMLAAVASVLAVAWLSLSGAGPTDARVAEGPPVIRFARVGSLLTSMAAPSGLPAADGGAVAESHAAAPVAARRVPQIGGLEPAPPAAGRSSAAVAASRRAVSASPAPAVSASAVPPAPAAAVVLSDADLIEMVIAATRALQGTGP